MTNIGMFLDRVTDTALSVMMNDWVAITLGLCTVLTAYVIASRNHYGIYNATTRVIQVVMSIATLLIVGAVDAPETILHDETFRFAVRLGLTGIALIVGYLAAVPLSKFKPGWKREFRHYCADCLRRWANDLDAEKIDQAFLLEPIYLSTSRTAAADFHAMVMSNPSPDKPAAKRKRTPKSKAVAT